MNLAKWNIQDTPRTVYCTFGHLLDSTLGKVFALFCISVALPQKYLKRIEFNVVAVGAHFVCQDFSYALKVSIVEGFEFIVLRHDARQAVNLKEWKLRTGQECESRKSHIERPDHEVNSNQQRKHIVCQKLRTKSTKRKFDFLLQRVLIEALINHEFFTCGKLIKYTK